MFANPWKILIGILCLSFAVPFHAAAGERNPPKVREVQLSISHTYWGRPNGGAKLTLVARGNDYFLNEFFVPDAHGRLPKKKPRRDAPIARTKIDQLLKLMNEKGFWRMAEDISLPGKYDGRTDCLVQVLSDDPAFPTHSVAYHGATDLQDFHTIVAAIQAL
jgi:hypothetical protein